MDSFLLYLKGVLKMEYKSNSFKSKEETTNKSEEKKIEKIVNGKVKKKKKTKFADIFSSEDVSNVKSYIIDDVLLPAVKRAINDMVSEGIHMLLYGEKSTKSSTPGSRVSYRSYYDKPDSRTSRVGSPVYNYDEIILETRGEAEDVLSRMDEIIDQYGIISVADFYDLVGVSSSYTDNKYGWVDIRTAEVIRTRDGYKIKLPRAKAL